MTRTKAQKAKAKAKNNGRNQRQVVANKSTGGLDRDGLAYAKLLADPCNAPLVYPAGTGDGGGYLVRAESDAIYHTGATDTCGSGYFCPAAISVGGDGIAVMGGNSDVTGYSYGLAPAADQPALGGVLASTMSFRVVSACLQVQFPGSELQRSGVIALGQTTWKTVSGTMPSTATMRRMANMSTRLPDGTLEIRMVPNSSTEEWSNVAAISSVTIPQPTLFWSVAGLPAGVGLRVRFVCVIEYKPAWNTGGVALNSNTRSLSNNTLGQVLTYLEKAGNWYIGMHTGVPGVASAGRQMIGW